MGKLFPVSSLDNETNIELSNEALKSDLSPNENTMKTIIPTPIAPVLEANRPTLEAVATAMRDFEGGKGDANWKNNNPLNCKYYFGGYLPMYEPVKISPAGFAIFKDYATGWLYGVNMLKNKIKHHQNWTILDMIADHAPSSDHNPVLQYAQNVAKKLGVDITYPCKLLV